MDGPVQLGVDQARRAPRRRRAGDAMEALSGLGRRRCGRAGALAGGGRRVGIDLVVHQFEEELAQVLLVGRVALAQVGADVEAVRVDKDDAEDGGEEAEWERPRREALLHGEILLARVVVPVVLRLRPGEDVAGRGSW